MIILFFVLLAISRRRRFEGQIMLAYAALYAAARFAIEFWRDDPRGSLFYLSTSQFIAITILLGALSVGVIRMRQRKFRIWVGASAILSPMRTD